MGMGGVASHGTLRQATLFGASGENTTCLHVYSAMKLNIINVEKMQIKLKPGEIVFGITAAWTHKVFAYIEAFRK